MKILFIPNFFNPGGSTLTCYELAKHIPHANMTFIGCVHGPYEKEFNKLGYVEILENIGGFDYNTRLDQIIKDIDPDIIHIFIPGHENPKYFDRLPANKKKICTVLCCQKIGFNPALFHHVTFLSKYNMGLSQPHDNFKVVRPGMGDNKELCYQPTNNKEVIFGRISAFCPSKLIHETIECAKLVPNKFIIAGEIQDSGYYTYCLQLARNCNNITLLTNINEQTKAQIYQTIDVLHYPTSNEAFCFSLLEGMRYGKAIITYNNSAIPELGPELMVSSEEELKNSTINLSKDIKKTREFGYNNMIQAKSLTGVRFAEEIIKLYTY